MDPSRGDSRYNLNYSMSSIGLSLADQDLYGNPGGLGTGRPPSGGLIQSMGRSGSGGGNGGGIMGHGGGNSGSGAGGQCQSLGSGQSRGIKRTSSDCYDEHHRGSGNMTSQTLQGLEGCGGGGSQSAGNVPDVVDDSYTSLQNKKSPPANGKKTKGRVKIKMEYIDNKLRRYTTFSKRKTGIMKKAYELSTLTGTQVMLLVASETGHVYTFATRKLQPMITSEAGKQLIQTCLNSPDPPSGGSGGGDQRMSATGFEETELSYNIADEDSKDDKSPLSSANESDDSSDIDSPDPSNVNASQTMLNDSTRIMDRSHNFHQQPSHAQGQSTNSIHYDVMKSASTFPQLPPSETVNNVLYPASALTNIPQEVLLSLVQSGHFQLQSDDDGSGHQFIAAPFSVASSSGNNNSTSTSISAENLSDAGKGGSNIGNNSAGTVSCNNDDDTKVHVKDLTRKVFPSGSSTIINGKESPPLQDAICIKKEIID